MSSRVPFPVAVFAAVVLVGVTWSNGFDGPFVFDDAHSLVNNLANRQLSNIPRFFVDPSHTSTLSTHYHWRPGVLTLHTLDVALGGGTPNPRVFHVSIFTLFVVLLGGVYLLALALFERTAPGSPLNRWLALLAATFFGVHGSNAETLDYISARSDSASTTMVVWALVARLWWPRARGLDLFFVTLGLTFKEPAVMAVGLFGLVAWLYGERTPRALIRTLAPVTLLALVYVVVSRTLVPPGWESGAPPRLQYWATQPFAVLHYFANFVFPWNFVIDTDWSPVTSPADDRLVVGVGFLVTFVALGVAAARRPDWRPVAFGMGWFLVTLLPTSLVPLGELVNDHRPFFGTVGLCIAATWLLALWRSPPAAKLAVVAVVLGANALVLHHRNDVWSDDLRLWKEATGRAGKSGRNHLNYATVLMRHARFAEARAALQKAAELAPFYAYVPINQGVVEAAEGQHQAAEPYFLRAIALAPKLAEARVFYAEWLASRGRLSDAKVELDVARALSPSHVKVTELTQTLGPRLTQVEAHRAQVAALQANPSAAGWLELSLSAYRNGEFPLSVQAARAALALEPNNAFAHNNVCAASNQLKDWQVAKEACERAVALDPSLEIARNNLRVSIEGLAPRP